MALFKKKTDPISERAKALNDEIAALEAQIKKLSEQEGQRNASPFAAPAATLPVAPPPGPAPTQPRLRSTALPRGLTVPATSSPAHEPIFEPVEQRSIQNAPEDGPPAPQPDLGTRKFNWATTWQRLKDNFRGPATSNPKLVSYLAAGSIQGLRPLRYEKRVARNRLIMLVVVLALVLWGIVWVITRSR
jgi:hypothetical protein